MYSLAFCLTALSLSLLVGLLDDPKPVTSRRMARLLSLLAVNTLGLYTHYYFLFFYVGETAVAAFVLLRRRAWKPLVSLAVPGLLFLAWVPQLLRQRERKFDTALWVIGPAEGRSYLEMLVTDGGAALARLVFGSIFQITMVVWIVAIALGIHALLRWRSTHQQNGALLLGSVALASYGALVANDLFHHTITLTREKYLFFLIAPLLLFLVRIALWNLPVIRFCLLAVFIAFNIVGIGRERLIQQHPDWRAIAARAEQVTGGKPLIVRDDDYFLCMSYYYKWNDQNLFTEDWLAVYPEDFWYLALYSDWKPEIDGKIIQMSRDFQRVELIQVDRFSKLIHFRVRPPEPTAAQRLPTRESPRSPGSE